jgi:Na+-translocating ferredoxin:NAD+ oxidoreductase RnfG subunit
LQIEHPIKNFQKLILLFSVTVTLGCTTTTSKNIPYTTTADRAFDCALGAARDTGLQVATSDTKAGIFTVVTGGGFAGGIQLSFAVDKQSKVVNVIGTNYGGGMPGAGDPEKLIAGFQTAFSKRCK